MLQLEIPVGCVQLELQLDAAAGNVNVPVGVDVKKVLLKLVGVDVGSVLLKLVGVDVRSVLLKLVGVDVKTVFENEDVVLDSLKLKL